VETLAIEGKSPVPSNFLHVYAICYVALLSEKNWNEMNFLYRGTTL